MASSNQKSDRPVKRRIAATAATAALALSGPAVAARPAQARTATPPRPPEPVTRIAVSDSEAAVGELELSRQAEMATHRHRLAGALAAAAPGGRADRIETALAAAEARMRAAYSRGERPDFESGLPAALAADSGLTADELDQAFEAMSRRAVERLTGSAS